MTDDNSDSDSSDVNVSRLRQMAIRGREYREAIDDFTYFGMEGDLYVKPLIDEEFLPIAAFLEDKLGIDHEEAQEKLEDGQDPDTGQIDPSQFDDEFVDIMKQAAALGIATDEGIAEGETRDGCREIVGATDSENDIGLIGGKTLVIAKRVLEISSDADKAETFRNGRGGE